MQLLCRMCHERKSCSTAQPPWFSHGPMKKLWSQYRTATSMGSERRANFSITWPPGRWLFVGDPGTCFPMEPVVRRRNGSRLKPDRSLSKQKGFPFPTRISGITTHLTRVPLNNAGLVPFRSRQATERFRVILHPPRHHFGAPIGWQHRLQPFHRYASESHEINLDEHSVSYASEWVGGRNRRNNPEDQRWREEVEAGDKRNFCPVNVCIFCRLIKRLGDRGWRDTEIHD